MHVKCLELCWPSTILTGMACDIDHASRCGGIIPSSGCLLTQMNTSVLPHLQKCWEKGVNVAVFAP